MCNDQRALVIATGATLAEANSVIELAVEGEQLATRRDFQADLDAGDFCMAFLAGLANVALATNEAVEKWLSSVHDAASGKSGDYGSAQEILGKAFFHKGDSLDVYAPGEGFVGRNGEKGYIAFHRLLFGHDLLARGKGVMPYNPFKIMYEQDGIRGIAQTMRHLIADTMSKQGLPLPGSSFLDTSTSNGRPWNRMIDWVQELSIEAFGSKAESQAIYSHLFTIRMQDAAGAGLTAALIKAYEKARRINDPVRVAQLELLGISIAFFGQAAVGATRQKGVPYINNAMVPQLALAYVALIRASGKRTNALGEDTRALERSTDQSVGRHNRLKGAYGLAIPADEDPKLIARAATELVSFLEEGTDGNAD